MKMIATVLAWSVSVGLVVGAPCAVVGDDAKQGGSAGSVDPVKPVTPIDPVKPVIPAKPDAKQKPMSLESESFANDTAFPKEFTADGADGEGYSPALKWADAPAGTVSFAIKMDDPDARGFVHWTIWGIAATRTSLPAKMPRDLEVKDPAGARQGLSSWGSTRPGYWGSAPGPGSGVHHYTFTVYALDVKLDLEAGATAKQFKKAIEGHVLSKATLVGLYERK